MKTGLRPLQRLPLVCHPVRGLGSPELQLRTAKPRRDLRLSSRARVQSPCVQLHCRVWGSGGAVTRVTTGRDGFRNASDGCSKLTDAIRRSYRCSLPQLHAPILQDCTKLQHCFSLRVVMTRAAGVPSEYALTGGTTRGLRPTYRNEQLTDDFRRSDERSDKSKAPYPAATSFFGVNLCLQKLEKTVLIN